MSEKNKNPAKVSHGNTVQHIESVLIEEIATGRLKPGERLDEVELAKRFGVSRTPIRETLTRLLAQGILVTGEKRGVKIAEYEKEELAQIFEAMFEIESACARIASQRLTLLNRMEIESAQAECTKMAEVGDIAGYFRANEIFHKAIYKATGNRFIAEIASDFRTKTGPFRAKKFASKADLLASAQSHDELIGHIFSDNSKAASEAMRERMTTSFMKVLAAN